MHPAPMLQQLYSSSSSVVSRALCAYSTFHHHPHPLGYPSAKFRFCRTPTAQLSRGENSDTQLLFTHLLTHTQHIWYVGNRSLSLRNISTVISQLTWRSTVFIANVNSIFLTIFADNTDYTVSKTRTKCCRAFCPVSLHPLSVTLFHTPWLYLIQRESPKLCSRIKRRCYDATFCLNSCKNYGEMYYR